MSNLQQIEARIEELHAELRELEAQAEEYYAAQQEAEMEEEIVASRTITNVDYLRNRCDYWGQISHYAGCARDDRNGYYMSLIYERRLMELGQRTCNSWWRSLADIDASIFRLDCLHFNAYDRDDPELLEEQPLDEWLDYADSLA